MDVEKYLRDTSDIDLMNHTLKELRSLYTRFYGRTPRSIFNKLDLITTMRYRLRIIDRGKHFNNI